MITNDTGGHLPAGPASRPGGTVDFTGRSQGLRGAELFPGMLDGAGPATAKRVPGMLPAPARFLYRAVWRPGYARTPRWGTPAASPGAERRTP